MKNFDYEKAKKRYNRMMYALCLEHLTIGTSFSEDTDGWNIRDMVSEAQYQLDLHYDPDTMTGMMRYSDIEGERKEWRSEVGKLARFIKAYQPYIAGIECKEGHCSKYD